MEEVVVIIIITETKTTSREVVILITKGAVIITTSPEVAKIITSVGVEITITNAVPNKATKNWIVLIVGKKAIMQGIVGQRMVSNLGKEIRKAGIFKEAIFDLPAKCRIS